MDQKLIDRIKGWLLWGMINAVWLLPLAYGIKCLVTQRGHYVGPRSGERLGGRRWRGELYPVEGEAAMWAGLGCIALSVFVCLSMHAKYDPEPSWFLQLVLVLVRWGSLLAMLWFWYKAGHL